MKSHSSKPRLLFRVIGILQKPRAKPMYQSGASSQSSTLLVYSAKAKTQQYAEADLNSWGCTDVNTVMLDGSESMKLRTKGGINIEGNASSHQIINVTERYVPQVITIFN